MAVIGHGSEPLQLPDTAFVGEAIGKNDIARSVVGRTRIAHELALGVNPFPSEEPASKMNPQRQLGHDHGGPPFGSCFLHPVCWWSWQKDSANLQQPTSRLGGAYYSGNLVLPFETVFWNRPHTTLPSPFIAPYSRLFLYFVAHKTSATSDLDVLLTPIGRSGNDGDEQAETVSITSTTPTLYKCATAYLPASGGRNRFRLEFSSTVAFANRLIVDAWALCNVVKRTH